MEKTLYSELKESERINIAISEDYSNFVKSFKNKYRIEIPPLGKFNGIYIPDYQKQIMSYYENNPVFCDAINGKISIEDTLNELSVVNKGIRKILPRRKDKAHNERIKQLGKLISEPSQLQKNGLLCPDNFLGFTLWGAGASFSIISPLFKIMLNPAQASPEEIENLNKIFNVYLPLYSTGAISVFGGIPMNLKQRFGKLPFEEAKYVDAKIKEVY
ncbi:MAG: hypothetical protein WC812_01730 [Candidatus Pacearchaeota archaeon]|jgi:hypothetical protein